MPSQILTTTIKLQPTARKHMSTWNPYCRRRLRRPMLTFSPMAWLKLQYFCHRGDTEIAGFGVTAAGRPLYIEEFVTIPQVTGLIRVSFPDDAVANYFDACVDQGLTPDRFARIWLHTHP